MSTEIRLKQLQEELRAALADGSEAARPVGLDQNKVGRLSRMDALQQQAMQQASQEALRKRLAEVALALEDLEEGEYGFCVQCGEEISPLRLEVKPEARLCIPCQEIAERSG